MKTFKAYETSDGTIHKSLLDANRHADKLYGDQLTKAKALLVFDAYVAGALLAGASVSMRKYL